MYVSEFIKETEYYSCKLQTAINKITIQTQYIQRNQKKKKSKREISKR